MKQKAGLDEALEAWIEIPERIGKAIRGMQDEDLDRRGGPEGWSIRETAHHLIEANLVASNMIIAALATNGGNYDWTWLNPDRKWMRRVGYDSAGLGAALAALRAVCRHIALLVAAQPGAASRSVKLNDAPGAKRYAVSVAAILQQEIDHASAHLAEIRSIASQRPKSG